MSFSKMMHSLKPIIEASFRSYTTQKEALMDWNRIEGSWKDLKGKVREKWAKLTDQDLDEIRGKKDQLIGKIQNYYGYGKDQVNKELNDFSTSLKDEDFSSGGAASNRAASQTDLNRDTNVH